MKLVDLTKTERQCLRAFDYASNGRAELAYRLIMDLGASERKSMRHTLAAIAIAIDGAHFATQGQFQKSVEVIESVLTYLERSNYANRLAWLYSTFGFSLGVLGDPESGLKWSLCAFSNSELSPKSVGQFTKYCNHGSLLGMLGRYEESIPFLQFANYEFVTQDSNDIFTGCYNLAYCYLEWARKNHEQGRRQELANCAVEYAQKAIAVGQKSSIYKDGIAAQSVYGSALLLLGNNADAAKIFNSALQKTVNNQSLEVDLMQSLARALFGMQHFSSAFRWLQKSDVLARNCNLKLALENIHETRLEFEKTSGIPIPSQVLVSLAG